jgi:hypothetical protein
MRLSDFNEILPFLSIGIALIALLVSIWTRVEAYAAFKRHRRIELARRVGEAFVSIQQTKNDLGDLIERLGSVLSDDAALRPCAVKQACIETLKKSEADYESIAALTAAFERVVIEFEHGNHISLDQSTIEAKIARYHQIRILAQYNSNYLDRLV